MSIDFNFVGPFYDPEFDRILFDDQDEIHELGSQDKTLGHVMHRVGAFTSVKEAKRNGWDQLVPFGWNEFKLPKKFHGGKLYIWNPTCTQKEFDEVTHEE